METKFTKIKASPAINNSPRSYTIIDKNAAANLLTIYFQKGEIERGGLNGVFLEDLLLICIDQLECFEDSPFACVENAAALTHLRNALFALRARQYERTIRGVQGRIEK